MVSILQNNLKRREYYNNLFRASDMSNKSLDIDIDIQDIMNRGDNVYREYMMGHAKDMLK